MRKRTPPVYPWTHPDGHDLRLIVAPATVTWSTWRPEFGSVEPAEPVFKARVVVRSAALIEGRYVLNDGPDRSASGDREWAWAAEQINAGANQSREYVLVPPGYRSANARNTTTKWSWKFLDIYDLAPGGVAWAPWEHEMPFASRAAAIAQEARSWLDGAHPQWRTESISLGVDAEIAAQRDRTQSTQLRIRELRAGVTEARRRIEILKAVKGEHNP